MLPLRHARSAEPTDKLLVPRLQRAIGVIYRPETERESHYIETCLPSQFDEVIWFDETSAVAPFNSTEIKGMPDTYPFGL